MKKIFLLSVIIGLSVSCSTKSVQPTKTTNETKSEQELIGGDVDNHGCKGSAGYTWSIIKNKCIRIFEGTKLSHAEEAGKTYTTSAYVVFEGDKAELFLDTQIESIVLERKSEGDSWVKNDLQLIPWKGYVLKKAGKIIYTGQ